MMPSKEKLMRIARALDVSRIKNNGLVPIGLFPHVLNIGGAYPGVELILYVTGKGFALKQRTKKEQGWDSAYHIVGTVIRKHDSVPRIFQRLAKETGLKRSTMMRRLSFVSPALYFAKPRNASCLSLFYRCNISPREFALLKGTWRIYPKNALKKDVIGPHKKILLRADKMNILPIAL